MEEAKFYNNWFRGNFEQETQGTFLWENFEFKFEIYITSEGLVDSEKVVELPYCLLNIFIFIFIFFIQNIISTVA